MFRSWLLAPTRITRAGLKMHRDSRRRLFTEAFQSNHSSRPHLIRVAKRSLRSNEYVEKIEQEKKHSEALLRNILPPEIAVRLRKGETNIADHFEDASIIFTDVVGFMKITARMRAFEIVACLNRLFHGSRRLADDVGAEKIKSVTATWPHLAFLTHARLAAKLALDFVSAAQRLQSSCRVLFIG